MISERLRRVVDDDRLGEVPSQDVEVLDVVAVDTNAVFAKQAILDVLSVGIQQVQQLVRVNFLGGGEQGDFVLGRDSLEKLPDVRSGPDEDLIGLVLKLDREREGGVVHLLQRAVDQSLVQVEDQRKAGTRSAIDQITVLKLNSRTR